MATPKKLTRRQLALIEELFAGESEEQEVLDKHKVGRQLYCRWLADKAFSAQLDQRVAGAYRQSTFLIARHARSAAEKLIGLTECEKEETARKACLDIITMNPSTGLAATPTTSDAKTEKPAPISPQTASRLLTALAEEKDDP